VVFDYHYFNTSDKAVEARSAFNLHLGKAEEIEHLAYRSQFANYTIDTPAKANGKFVGECKFKQDVMVGGITRHTHRWGTDFDVWFEGGFAPRSLGCSSRVRAFASSATTRTRMTARFASAPARPTRCASCSA
jgi:hypothetical protein